jgi:hypothetical protein
LTAFLFNIFFFFRFTFLPDSFQLLLVKLFTSPAPYQPSNLAYLACFDQAPCFLPVELHTIEALLPIPKLPTCQSSQ